jgi:hypothetical protein
MCVVRCVARMFVCAACVQVSRRKGHLYRVFVEPDFELATPKPRLPLNGVFSNPICVMSKRKTGERVVASQIRHEAVRAWIPALTQASPVTQDVADSLKALMSQIAVLSKTLDTAVELMQSQVCTPVCHHILFSLLAVSCATAVAGGGSLVCVFVVTMKKKCGRFLVSPTLNTWPLRSLVPCTGSTHLAAGAAKRPSVAPGQCHRCDDSRAVAATLPPPGSADVSVSTSRVVHADLVNVVWHGNSNNNHRAADAAVCPHCRRQFGLRNAWFLPHRLPGAGGRRGRQEQHWCDAEAQFAEARRLTRAVCAQSGQTTHIRLGDPLVHARLSSGGAVPL